MAAANNKYYLAPQKAVSMKAGAASSIGKNSLPVADNRKGNLQKKKNNTGLPGNLKSGIENLSGLSMDDVRVHFNSAQPAQLQAHAFAQGTDIHIAPGQEKHLPHEAWHVVQQKQGRVKPTIQMKGSVDVNDDRYLEREADIMGAKSLQMMPADRAASNNAAYKLTSVKVWQCRKIDIDNAEKDYADHEIADIVIKELGMGETDKGLVIRLIEVAYPGDRKVDKLTHLIHFVRYHLSRDRMSPREKFNSAATFTSLQDVSVEAAITSIREVDADHLTPDSIYPWLLNDAMVIDNDKFRLWGYLKDKLDLRGWPSLKNWLSAKKKENVEKEKLSAVHAREIAIQREIAIMESLQDRRILMPKDGQLKGAFNAFPEELLFKIFAFVEQVVKTRHAPAEQHVLVPEYPQFLARLRGVNKYFRLLVDKYNADDSRAHIGKGITDARRMNSGLSPYLWGIRMIVIDLLKTYPPDKNCYFSLGGSPTPIAIALEKFPGKVKADVYHLPLGDIKGSVSQWMEEADKNWTVLAKYISRFVPAESELAGRNVVVIDYVSMGTAINTVTRILSLYYKGTKVYGAGLLSTMSKPTLDKNISRHELSPSLGKAMENKTFKKAGLRTTASITLQEVLSSKDIVPVRVDFGALLKMLAIFSKMYADDEKE